MTLRKVLFSALPAVLFAAGCSSLPELEEPDPIPVCIASYRASELIGKAEHVAVALDVDDCVEAALLVSKGVFGGSSVDAAYPVRVGIEREFLRVIDQNFCEPTGGDHLKIRVSTMRVLLTKSGRTCTSDVSVTVRLMHSDETRGPLFRKTYRVKSSSRSDDEDLVPKCFYESVQNIAEQFVTDVASNRNLVWYLEAKQKEMDK